MARRKQPRVPTSWEWFCEKVRNEGIDPETTTLAEAAEVLVARLELGRAECRTLSRSAVDLAAMLVRFYATLVAEDAEPTWKNAEPLIFQTLARRIADNLEIRYAITSYQRTPRLPPEPVEEEPLVITMYDLVKTFESVLQKTRQKQDRPAASAQ